MKLILSRILATLLVIINLFFNIFGLTSPFKRKTIDMSKFQDEPTFCEEFDGTSLNRDIWTMHYAENDIRRGSYWTYDMAEVYDGALHIKTKYLENGSKGPGWYTAGIDTNKSFEQTYGYFECRCIFPKGHGLWSAFWLLNREMPEVSNGISGAEIDVMESQYWEHRAPFRNATRNTIHYGGYGEAHQSVSIGPWSISGDPYNEYHTYAVEWNRDGYSFYIDGEFRGFTKGGGASQADEFLILSVEVGGENGVPAESWVGKSIEENEEGRNFEADFIVDYVKVYQYK